MTGRSICSASFCQADRDFVVMRKEIKLMLADSSFEKTGTQQHFFALGDSSKWFLFLFCFLFSGGGNREEDDRKLITTSTLNETQLEFLHFYCTFFNLML